MTKKKKVIKRHIKWKMILKLFLFLCFIFLLYVGIMNIKTARIIIKGNNYLSDHDIILASGFKEYPYLFRVRTKDIQNSIKQLDMIGDVSIHKSLLGTLTIEVKELRPLFYNRNNSKLVLTTKKEINTTTLEGVPILINYVPDSYYDKLVDKLSKIEEDVISLISEIEYQPWKSNDTIIDNERFFLRMNDGNNVYVNLINIEKLNNYIEIYASLENKKGTLYLDSSSDKISFSETQPAS